MFIVFGFVVGLIARAVMPGDQKMGLLMTTVLGVIGSFVGGFIASVLTSHPYDEFHTAGIIGSVVGALVVMLVVGMVGRRRGFGRHSIV